MTVAFIRGDFSVADTKYCVRTDNEGYAGIVVPNILRVGSYRQQYNKFFAILIFTTALESMLLC